MKIAILAGDGIGPEIVAQAVRVLEALRSDGLKIELEPGLWAVCGRCRGRAISRSDAQACRRGRCRAVRRGRRPQYDTLPRPLRPEKGLLGLRKSLEPVRQPAPGALYPSSPTPRR